MNFQNFYILIFKNNIRAKHFVFTSLFLLLITLFLSFIINILSFNITGNDIIKTYQLNKIKSVSFSNIDTIVVGDSSGGNAIDSKYLDEISGLKSENLCLTGSWGILGSLGIIKKSLEENPSINNIIIIQTLDIWEREYSKESILELFNFRDQVAYLSFNQLAGYYFNPKEIWWTTKYLIKQMINTQSNNIKIDMNNDYILQNEKKYSNGFKKITKSDSLDSVKLGNSKIKELDLLERYCREESLNCIFLNGPIHKEIYDNSQLLKLMIKNKVRPKFSYIKYYPKIFPYEKNKIGDSSDHIDVNFKKESTLMYYNTIKKDLLFN